jgi:hypothetical protein
VQKRFLTIFILLFPIFVNAQSRVVQNLTTYDNKKIHFGFTLGLNSLDFGVEHYASLDDNPNFDPNEEITVRYLDELEAVNRQVRTDIYTLTPGFTVSIVSNLRLGEYFDLRFLPGLSFGNRRMVYNVPLHDFVGSAEAGYYSARSTYIDLPLLIKYKSKRYLNQRPYMIGGFAYRHDISRGSPDEIIRLVNPNFYFEAGMGWDSYLQFFRFSTELKFSFGLNNVLGKIPEHPTPTYYNYAIKRLTSNIVTLSFHFE